MLNLRDIPEGVQATHWSTCWREHKGCVDVYVERLTAERDALQAELDDIKKNKIVIDPSKGHMVQVPNANAAAPSMLVNVRAGSLMKPFIPIPPAQCRCRDCQGPPSCRCCVDRLATKDFDPDDYGLV